MKIAALAASARRPESEVEWEDLLVRIEVMPRALRVLLEGVDGSDPTVRALLADLLRREAFASDFLERAAGHPGEPQTMPTQEDAVERFVRLRTRNFAMMQRRGIDVWEWEAEIAGGGTASVYQLLSALAAGDVDLLAALRGFSGTGSGAC
ncbi:MAG: hypothetical protein WD766_14670 [Gemmatimonadota bacterium]